MGKRQAKKLEPITLDDLLGNSSMEGLVSFLDLPARPISLPPKDELLNNRQEYPVGPVYVGPVSPVDTDYGCGQHVVASKNELKESPNRDSTVGSSRLTTVPSGYASTPPPTVVSESVPTVGGDYSDSPQYPVVSRQDPAWTTSVGTGPGRQWVTEEGQVVSEKQIHSFRLAQDSLNPNERAVYQVLWNAREAQPITGEPNIKLIRIGYDAMARQSNMAKKTIQRVIPRLISKGFIEVAQAPDFLTRTPSAYRVHSFKKVLDLCKERGRTHIAKLGHGISFIQPIPPGTVDSAAGSTVVRKSSTTVVIPPPPTVVRKSSSLESLFSNKEIQDVQSLENQAPSHYSFTSSSSSLPESPNSLSEGLRALLQRYQTELDSDAIQRLWNECRRRVPDCTAEEVLYFSQAKAMLFSTGKINNPVGFLLFAVPKCFEGHSFEQFRKEQQQARLAELERARRAEQEMQQVRQQLLDMVNDASSSDADRRFAERLLNEGYAFQVRP